MRRGSYRRTAFQARPFPISPGGCRNSRTSCRCGRRASNPADHNLNLSRYLVTDFLDSTGIDYGYSCSFPKMGHTGNITNHDLVEEIAAYMISVAGDAAAQALGK